MKHISKKALILTCAVAVLGLSSHADAREKTHSGTWQGKKHGGTWSENVNRTKGTVTKDRTWTSEKGTGNSEVIKNKNADGTGWTAHKTGTTASGKTFSSDNVGTKTATGATVQGTHTGPNGKTVTTSSDIVKTDDGRVVTTTATGANGKTSTKEADYSHSDGNWTKDVTKTGVNGKVRTWQKTGTYNP